MFLLLAKFAILWTVLPHQVDLRPDFFWIALVSSQYKVSSMVRMMPCHAIELTLNHSSVSDVHFDGICMERCSMKAAFQPGAKRTWMLCSFSGVFFPKRACHMAQQTLQALRGGSLCHQLLRRNSLKPCVWCNAANSKTFTSSFPESAHVQQLQTPKRTKGTHDHD